MAPEVRSLCPANSVTLFRLPSLQKTTKEGCGKWKQCFHCFYGNLWIFCLDFNPKRWQICSWLKHNFKATVTCNLLRLLFFQWIHSFAFRGSFLIGKYHSNSSESRERWSCTWWENEGPGSVSSKIPAHVWNMSNVPLFTRCPHSSSLALNAATLPTNLTNPYF